MKQFVPGFTANHWWSRDLNPSGPGSRAYTVQLLCVCGDGGGRGGCHILFTLLDCQLPEGSNLFCLVNCCSPSAWLNIGS